MFYYPIGLFDSNNLLPSTNWNRLIFRYKFLNNTICFIPSITKSFSNNDQFSLRINDEFNKLLFSVISFIERKNDNILINNKDLTSFQINKRINYDHYNFDMVLNVIGKKINIFDYRLLPFPTEYNSYYSNHFSPELFDMKVIEEMINYLKILYGSTDLEIFGFNKDMFDNILESFYKPTKFNISIFWWFITNNNTCKDLSSRMMFNLKDNINRIFSPLDKIEKLYYLTKVEIVDDIKLLSMDWLTSSDVNESEMYYTFNEIIHLINRLVMRKDDHFYFKYQSYSDISDEIKRNKTTTNDVDVDVDVDDNDEANKLERKENIKCLDTLPIKFIHNNRLYKTTLKDLYERNYLNLDELFSLQRTINKKLYFDQNEYINYLYYLN